MTIYDPFLVRWLEGAEGRNAARISVWDAVVPVNARFSEIYRAAGLRVADVEGAFATTDFDTVVELEPFGLVPINVARACQWTWAGTPPPLGPDMHANAQGYRVIAEAFAPGPSPRRLARPRVGSARRRPRPPQTRNPPAELPAGFSVLGSCRGPPEGVSSQPGLVRGSRLGPQRSARQHWEARR